MIYSTNQAQKNTYSQLKRFLFCPHRAHLYKEGESGEISFFEKSIDKLISTIYFKHDKKAIFIDSTSINSLHELLAKYPNRKQLVIKTSDHSQEHDDEFLIEVKLNNQEIYLYPMIFTLTGSHDNSIKLISLDLD